MDELAVVVDERDQVTGHWPKKECHAKGVLHRSAAVLVFRDATFREVLFQVRSAGSSNPGKLCLPGGHLNPGETYLDCARREFLEEMHAQVANSRDPPQAFEQLLKLRKTADNDNEFLALFRAVDPGPFTPDPTEVASWEFWPLPRALQALDKGAFTETTALLLAEYQKLLLKFNNIRLASSLGPQAGQKSTQ